MCNRSSDIRDETAIYGQREEGGKLNEREDGDETKKKKWCGARKDEEKKLAKFLAYHP